MTLRKRSCPAVSQICREKKKKEKKKKKLFLLSNDSPACSVMRLELNAKDLIWLRRPCGIWKAMLNRTLSGELSLGRFQPVAPERVVSKTVNGSLAKQFDPFLIKTAFISAALRSRRMLFFPSFPSSPIPGCDTEYKSVVAIKIISLPSVKLA